MIDELYNDFLIKLKKLYGSYEPSLHRFEKASNSEISRELGYSDAQFSRLINKSATEGEYQRAIQNVERILKLLILESQVERLSDAGKNSGSQSIKKWLLYSLLLLLAISVVALTYIQFSRNTDDEVVDFRRDDMLRWSFETSYISPYTTIDDLPGDCNFPCYKYQGRWKLANNYKIPFFRERNGFHYLATEVNMYARCMTEKSETGDYLEGYEYQKHEIWYDKRELPIDSFLVVNDNAQLRKFYAELDFNDDQNFVKVANIHTFFRNEFNLDSAFIHRKGKVIARDVEFVNKDELRKKLGSDKMVDYMFTEVNSIVNNRLDDFSRPISCENAPLPVANFNNLVQGAEITFECQLTTSRFPVPYKKTYKLVDQFIKNTCVPE